MDLQGDAVLTVRGLRKQFGRRHVLDGVELDVRRGEILALVGENGAGKSTVVRCVARAIPADAGSVVLDGRALAADPIEARDQGIAVVWQDLALCDNLSIVANLFLGGETTDRGVLDDRSMVDEAVQLFERLHLPTDDLFRAVGLLSGGQRQLVAIARAVRRRPSVLVLDEPTAALGAAETRVVERLLAELRDAGAAILLVSHRLDQVFALADRIAVMRQGRIIADVSPVEVHPDDVVAMMSGIETDSSARRQLHRLTHLIEELADVDPAAALSLIVSAMVESLGIDQLCVHLLDDEGILRRSAAVGLPADVLAVAGPDDPPGRAVATGEVVVVEASGRPPRSAWSVPIVGSDAVIGAVSGFADTPGRLHEDQLELVQLHARLAAAAIERDRLLADATRRNRLLETLRGVLDTLAGPEQSEGGIVVALLALGRGLGADSIALHRLDGTAIESSPVGGDRRRAAAEQVLASSSRLDRARPIGTDVLAVPIDAPEGRVVVAAWWADPSRLSDDALDLLDDAARSLRLALERQALESANAEAASLRRTQSIQREFLSRLNHELRTPLTAIQGYAETLRQDDVTWDAPSQERFLDSIASESARMGRLVGDLLDFSAIDSGTLRLVPDWCELPLVLDAARRCIPEGSITLQADPDLPPLWADHDRLQQVFVNLLDNAVRHGADGAHARVEVDARVEPGGEAVVVQVRDHGPGIPPSLAVDAFLPHARGSTTAPGAGLGLAIARGIVDAHGGTIGLAPCDRGTTMVVTLPVEPVEP